MQWDSAMQNKFPSRQTELRASIRISVTKRGLLTSTDDPYALTQADERFPCLIQNMSETGFLLMCTRQLELGQILDLRCELFPQKVLECKLEVVHVGDSVIGTRIVDISASSASLCKSFLDGHFSPDGRVRPGDYKFVADK